LAECGQSGRDSLKYSTMARDWTVSYIRSPTELSWSGYWETLLTGPVSSIILFTCMTSSLLMKFTKHLFVCYAYLTIMWPWPLLWRKGGRNVHVPLTCSKQASLRACVRANVFIRPGKERNCSAQNRCHLLMFYSWFIKLKVQAFDLFLGRVISLCEAHRNILRLCTP